MIAIIVKHLPPTDTKPSRLKAFTSGDRKALVINYDKAENLAIEAGNGCQANIYYQVVKLWCQKYLTYYDAENMRFGEIDIPTVSGYVFCFDKSTIKTFN